jgi:hypothetical protein
MSYVIPNFNIVCNIYDPDTPGVPEIPSNPPRIVAQECALVYGRRVNVASTGGTTLPGVPLMAMSLLVPKGTDIRGPQDTTSFDMVECPAGTGRWYWVCAVDDIGRGWANEHRSASIFALAGSWAPPYA